MMLDRRRLEELLDNATRNFNGLGYNLNLVSVPERKTQTIYINATEAGLEYEVIGLSQNLEKALISWAKLPGFPRNSEEIIKLENPSLLYVFKILSDCGHILSVNRMIEFEEILKDRLQMTAPMSNWTLEHLLCLAVPLCAPYTLLDRVRAKQLLPEGYVFYLIREEASFEECDLKIMTSKPSLTNLPPGTSNTYVLVQETPGELPSELYFVDRRFNDVYVTPIFFPTSDMTNFIASLFPGSNVGDYSDVLNLSPDQLSMVNAMTDHRLIDKGRIYVKVGENNTIEYRVRSKLGEVYAGFITTEELNQEIKKPLTMEVLHQLSDAILDVAYRRKHVHLNPHGHMNYVNHYKVGNKPEDLLQAATEMLKDFDDTLKLFRSREEVAARNFIMPPIKWLEQCFGEGRTIGAYDVNSDPIGYKQEINIPRIMRTVILAVHYGLGISKVLNDEEVVNVNRCKIGRAAQILGKDEESVISECIKRGCGVYIKTAGLKIHHYSSTPLSISVINEIKKNGYQFGYKGLARLADRTLNNFLEGDLIECPNADQYRLIDLQPSLSELVQGNTASHIQLRPNEVIRHDECIFIEEELCFQKEDTKKPHSDNLDMVPGRQSKVEVIPNKNKWIKNGEFYEISIEEKSAIISATNGATHIANLIKQRGKEVHVNQLEQMAAGLPVFDMDKASVSIEEGKRHHLHVKTKPGKKADRQTIKAVEARLVDVKEQLDDLQILDNGCDEEIEAKKLKLNAEKTKLDGYLKDVKRIHGKTRDFSDEGDKARLRVWQAIKDVLDKLQKNDHVEIHDYLKERMKKGFFCVFKKHEGDVEWEVS